MDNTLIPRHIAVIMDGNGRWAKKRLIPRKMGHHAGAKAVRKLIEVCAQKGIEVLTLFAFSSENWHRPVDEVNALMELFLSNLEKEFSTLQDNNICLRVIGNRLALSDTLQQRISDVEQKTQHNARMTLVLAVSYGGRWDIVNAAKSIAERVKQGELDVADIDEVSFAQHLSLADLPEPDLFIRTSGEQRLSNFLMWQLAYTELYFTEKYWPDFDVHEFELALQQFAKRERRFGLTSEQLTEEDES